MYKIIYTCIIVMLVLSKNVVQNTTTINFKLKVAAPKRNDRIVA